MKMYDAERIIEDADIPSVIESLGIEVRKHGSRYFCLCPIHKKVLGTEDKNIGSCWLTPRGGYCAACGQSFSIIDVVKDKMGYNYPKALEYLANLNGGIEGYVISGENTKAMKQQPTPLLKKEDLAIIGLSPEYGKSFIPLSWLCAEDDELDGKMLVLTMNILNFYKKENTEPDKDHSALKNNILKQKERLSISQRIALEKYGSKNLNRSCEDIFTEDAYTETLNREHMLVKKCEASIQKLYQDDYMAYLSLIVRKCRETDKKLDAVINSKKLIGYPKLKREAQKQKVRVAKIYKTHYREIERRDKKHDG